MDAPTATEMEKPDVGKSFRVTPSQDRVIVAHLELQGSTLTRLVEDALREFFTRRRIEWPETKYRRPW